MESTIYLDVVTPCEKGDWFGYFTTDDCYNTRALVNESDFVDHLVDKIYKLLHKKNEYEYTYRTGMELYYYESCWGCLEKRTFVAIAYNTMHHTFEVLHWPNGSDGRTMAIKESHGKLTKGIIKNALLTGARNCYNIFPDKEDEA